jgi:peptide/nickel transport system substrate-binding protein
VRARPHAAAASGTTTSDARSLATHVSRSPLVIRAPELPAWIVLEDSVRAQRARSDEDGSSARHALGVLLARALGRRRPTREPVTEHRGKRHGCVGARTQTAAAGRLTRPMRPVPVLPPPETTKEASRTTSSCTAERMRRAPHARYDIPTWKGQMMQECKPQVLAVLAAVLLGAAPASASTLTVDENFDLDSIDPALAYQSNSWQLEYATCLKLLNSADASGAAGSQLVPDAAISLPSVSADGLTYTFTVRDGLRFSPPSGEQVDAQTFKHAIERVLTPAMGSPGVPQFRDIAGAQAVIDGTATTVSGIVASGQTLAVTLTAPRPDFLDRLATPFACAVPRDTPVVPGGVSAPLASAGPYYIAARTPGVSTTLERNPAYTGSRPHGFDEIVDHANVDAATVEADILAGRADYTAGGFPEADAVDLYARFGPGSAHQQFFVHPGPGITYLALNTSRPLFSTVRVRKAVNFAIDRQAMLAVFGAFAGTPTDQILPPGLAAFHDAHIYPLQRPDFRTARRLLGSTTGTASIYTCDLPFCSQTARIVRRDLARIGLRSEIHAFPLGEYFTRKGTRGEPFDIAIDGWLADYPDGFDVINVLLDGRSITATGNANISYFHDPVFEAKMDAAELLFGAARDQAYGDLDVDLMRHAAPWVPLFNPATRELLSTNVQNEIFSPTYDLDLAALTPA